MDLEKAKVIWESIDKLDESEQQKLLSKKLCDREPIHRFADIRLGDHLVRKGSTFGLNQYEHHFLCTGFTSEKEPEIVHYFNTAKNASRQMITTGSFASGKSLGKLGKIQMVTIQDFIGSDEAKLQEKGKEVARVVWPEGFRRYSVDEIVKRAQTRMHENNYNLVKNNCESYVMWCLCDVNITLQVTTAKRSLFEVLCAGTRAIAGGIYQGVKTVVKECAPFVDDFFGPNIVRRVTESQVGKVVQNFLAKRGPIDFGCILTLLFEFGIAACDIKDAYKKWKGTSPEIESREDFIKAVLDTVMMALAHFCGSCAGGLPGVVIAHLVTRFLFMKFSKYPAKCIDTAIVSASNTLDQFYKFVKENIDKMTSGVM